MARINTNVASLTAQRGLSKSHKSLNDTQSTLRQFTQVWDIETTDDRGRQLVDILRARLFFPKIGIDHHVDRHIRIGGFVFVARVHSCDSRLRAPAAS